MLCYLTSPFSCLITSDNLIFSLSWQAASAAPRQGGGLSALALQMAKSAKCATKIQHSMRTNDAFMKKHIKNISSFADAPERHDWLPEQVRLVVTVLTMYRPMCCTLQTPSLRRLATASKLSHKFMCAWVAENGE